MVVAPAPVAVLRSTRHGDTHTVDRWTVRVRGGGVTVVSSAFVYLTVLLALLTRSSVLDYKYSMFHDKSAVFKRTPQSPAVTAVISLHGRRAGD